MRRIATYLAVFLLVAAALPVAAQSLTGTVEGVVKDEQGGVLPGVTVTLTGKRGSQAWPPTPTGATASSGRPRHLHRDRRASGFRPKRQENVVVGIGRTTGINLALGVAGVQEQVEVVGESPVVNPVSSATDNALSQDMLFNLPIRPSNAATDLLNYLPGIVDGSAYGADSDTANGLLIDGVDTRDPEGGSAWTFFNYNIVEEVQVERPRRPGRVRLVPGRGGQHHHEVGREPLLRPVRRLLHEGQPPGQQHQPGDHRRQPLAGRPRQGPTAAGPHRPARRARSSRTSSSSS